MINLTPLTQYPATLPSAAFWYTADKAPLGQTASWAGQLFNNPAIQGTAANQPVNTANLIGGKPAVLFDGVNDNLSAASTTINSGIFTTGGTIAGVFSPVGAGGSNEGRIYDKTGGGTTAGSMVFFDNLSTRLNFSILFSGADGSWVSNAGTVNINQSYFFVITYDGSSVANNPTLYLNSTFPVTFTRSVAPTGTIGVDVGNALFIGNRTGNDRAFNGSIAEICGFRTILTGTNLNLLINYFRNKYGL